MPSIEALVAIGGLFLSIIAALLGAFKFVSAEISKLRNDVYKEIAKNKEATDADHDDVMQQMTDLALATVRKQDLEALERRLTETMARHEAAMREAQGRAEQLRGIAFERLNADMQREMRELNAMMRQLLGMRTAQAPLPLG